MRTYFGTCTWVSNMILIIDVTVKVKHIFNENKKLLLINNFKFWATIKTMYDDHKVNWSLWNKWLSTRWYFPNEKVIDSCRWCLKWWDTKYNNIAKFDTNSTRYFILCIWDSCSNTVQLPCVQTSWGFQQIIKRFKREILNHVWYPILILSFMFRVVI